METGSAKGKGKLLEEDDDGLNPTITYRHLLSDNVPVVLNPLRVVALCDLDAFYASSERVRLGLDPSLPLVVQQWQALIAVNYPARKYGITRMETVTEAKKKCPKLVVVHTATYKEGESEAAYHENPSPTTHKVSLDHYRRESMKIMSMQQKNMPDGGEVEKASIDEGFFDFTTPVKRAILSRYPHLASPPADAPNGLDTPLPPPPKINWDGIGNVIPAESTHEPEKLPEEVSTLDNNSSEGSPAGPPAAPVNHGDTVPTTWHHIALSIAAEYMLKMRIEVKEKLGYTTSAGLARNKTLAKLAASFKKHDEQSILRNEAIPHFLRPMAFQKIRFLGGKLGAAMAEEYGAKTVGDVLGVSLDEMQRKFGEESIWVYNVLRGIDHSEVKDRIDIKSMLASKNIRPPITDLSQAVHWLKVLSGDLAVRLIEGRERAPNLWPKTVVLHIRQGFEATRSKQVAFPFSREGVTADLILKHAEKLWKELTGGNNRTYSINNISLAFSGLGYLENGQQGIEGFFGKHDSVAGEKRKHLMEEDDDEVVLLDHSGNGGGSASTTAAPLSFQCDRCKRLIHLPKEVAKRNITREAQTSALESLQAEHGDFHFAQDLARQRFDDDDNGDGDVVEIEKPKLKRTNVDNATQAKKKVKREEKGIAKYFGARGGK